jgi:hypothetical protein
MSSLGNLLKLLSEDQQRTKEHYVYFDNETKRIHKISPVKQDTEQDCFAIESVKVEPILKGSNRLDDFFVYFNYATKKLDIQRKINSNFSSVSLVEIKDEIDADFKVTVTSTDIKVSLTDDLNEHIIKDGSETLLVVTEKHNPYKLYYSFKFNTSMLVDDIKLDHQLTTDQLRSGVSIYTPPMFNSYSLKVDYD